MQLDTQIGASCVGQTNRPTGRLAANCRRLYLIDLHEFLLVFQLEPPPPPPPPARSVSGNLRRRRRANIGFPLDPINSNCRSQQSRRLLFWADDDPICGT